MKNTNENTLTEDERKFLEENFQKYTTLQMALKGFEKTLQNYLIEKGEKLIKNNSDVFKNIKMINSKSKSYKEGYYSFYQELQLHKNEFFKSIRLGITYHEWYKCGDNDGYYTFIAIWVTKSGYFEKILKFFKNSLYIRPLAKLKVIS